MKVLLLSASVGKNVVSDHTIRLLSADVQCIHSVFYVAVGF